MNLYLIFEQSPFVILRGAGGDDAVPPRHASGPGGLPQAAPRPWQGHHAPEGRPRAAPTSPAAGGHAWQPRQGAPPAGPPPPPLLRPQQDPPRPLPLRPPLAAVLQVLAVLICWILKIILIKMKSFVSYDLASASCSSSGFSIFILLLS